MQKKNNKKQLKDDLIDLYINPVGKPVDTVKIGIDLYNIAKEEAERCFSDTMINYTKNYHKKYGFNAKEDDKLFSTHNNEADAFKHTFMQAYLTVNYGENVALKLGNMHEKDGKDNDQPSGEENMDLWNNNQGREIGREVMQIIHTYNLLKFDKSNKNDLIAKKVIERMKAGKLITHPSDPRRYVSKNKSGTTTGQAAPISSSINSNSVTQSNQQNKSSKTSSQNFSDIIRQKYKSQQSENNKKFNRIFKSHNTSTPTGSGHWVTINGAHIFIED